MPVVRRCFVGVDISSGGGQRSKPENDVSARKGRLSDYMSRNLTQCFTFHLSGCFSFAVFLLVRFTERGYVCKSGVFEYPS